MNDIQFSILRHAAGEGPAIPRDAPGREAALRELGKSGLLEMFSPCPGHLPPAPVADRITFDGRCVYEAERDRRKAATNRAVLRSVGVGLAKIVASAALAALALRYLGPKPVCESPCRCNAAEHRAAKQEDQDQPSEIGNLSGIGVEEIVPAQPLSQHADDEADCDDASAEDGETAVGNAEPVGSAGDEKGGQDVE